MPITPLALTTRASAGAALTQTQFDGNYTAVQTAVNALIIQVAAALTDAGVLKDGGVTTAAKIANSIITLAKLAALSGADLGGFLRANASTGVIAAVQLQTQVAAASTEVNSAGAQAGLNIGTFTFNSVPAGNVLIWGSAHVLRNAGANGGTVSLEVGATTVDDTETHRIDTGTTDWHQLTLLGMLSAFAGGTLTVNMVFETSEVTSDVTFGVAGESRFGRRVMIMAGL